MYNKVISSFKIKRSKVKVTGPINAHTVNTQYLPNGKAYELQTWCWYTDGARSLASPTSAMTSEGLTLYMSKVLRPQGHAWQLAHKLRTKQIPETPKLVLTLPPRAIKRTGSRSKGQTSRSRGWSIQKLKVCRARTWNFPGGWSMRYQLPWLAMKACKVGLLNAGGGIPCRPHPSLKMNYKCILCLVGLHAMQLQRNIVLCTTMCTVHILSCYDRQHLHADRIYCLFCNCKFSLAQGYEAYNGSIEDGNNYSNTFMANRRCPIGISVFHTLGLIDYVDVLCTKFLFHFHFSVLNFCTFSSTDRHILNQASCPFLESSQQHECCKIRRVLRPRNVVSCLQLFQWQAELAVVYNCLCIKHGCHTITWCWTNWTAMTLE